VVAEAVVSGVGLGAARVSFPGSNYAMDGPELGIRAPKSAQGEGGGFGFDGDGGKDTKTTQRYAHLAPGAIKDAALKSGDLLTPKPKPNLIKMGE
jgi:hypothetical protein